MLTLRENFFDHATTHMQRVANCIQSMSELSVELHNQAEANPLLAPIFLRIVNLFENTGESVVSLQDDLLEISKASLPSLLLSNPPDTPDGKSEESGSSSTSPSESTPPESQY